MTQPRARASDYLSTVATQLSCLVIGVMSGALAARLLGPHGRGELAVLAYFPSLLGTIFCLAVPQATTYFVARTPESRSKYASAALVIAAALGLTGSLLFAFVAPKSLTQTNQHLAKSVSLVSLASLPMVLTPTIVGISQGLGRFSAVNVSLLTNSAGYLIAILALHRAALLSPLTCAFAPLVATLVAGTLLAKDVLYNLTPLRWPPKEIVGQTIAQSVGFFAPVATLLVLGQLDRAVLIRRGSLQDMAFYAIAFSTAYPLALAGEAVAQVSFVEVARAGRRSSALALLVRRFRLEQVIIALAAAAVFAVAPFFVTLVYGHEYSPSIKITYVLVLAMTLRGIARPLENGIRAFGSPVVGATAGVLAISVFGVTVHLLRTANAGVAVSLAVAMAQAAYLAALIASLRWSFGVPLASLVGLRREVLLDVVCLVRRAVGGDPGGLREMIVSPRVLLGMWWEALVDHHYSPLAFERAYRAIVCGSEQHALARLRAETAHVLRADPAASPKFLDSAYWVRANIVRALRAGLQKGTSKTVLDLGCGPGHFLAVARHFGHSAIGLELPDECLSPIDRQIYDAVLRAYGLTNARIRGIVSPDGIEGVRGRVDLVTGFLVCFEGHRSDHLWMTKEWSSFLDACALTVCDGGRIYLELNANPDRFGSLIFYDVGTLQLFRERGVVNGPRVLIRVPQQRG